MPTSKRMRIPLLPHKDLPPCTEMSRTRNRPAFHLGCSECLRGSRLPTEGAKQIFQLNYHLVKLSQLEPVSFQSHQENLAETRVMLCLQEKVQFTQEKDPAEPVGPGPDEEGRRAGIGPEEVQSSHQSGGLVTNLCRCSPCARASLSFLRPGPHGSRTLELEGKAPQPRVSMEHEPRCGSQSVSHTTPIPKPPHV